MRVHATGRKLYVVQSRGPTGLKRVTLGRHGELATDEARKLAAVVIDRIKRGEDPMPAPLEPELTIADLAERFMRVHVKMNCKPSTAATYRGHLGCHILPALGGMAISAVGRGEVAALHHRLRDTPPTANAVVRCGATTKMRQRCVSVMDAGWGLLDGSGCPDGAQDGQDGKKSGGKPLEIDRRGREVGLDLHVVEAAPDRASEPVPGLRLAVEALGAP